jgi:hypothetical protein
MRKFVTWLLIIIGFVTLGLAIYVARIEHNLSVGLRQDFDRRFMAAAERAIPLGVPYKSTENDRVRIGQAMTAEYIISVQVVSYHNKKGFIPSSVAEIDPNGLGRPQSTIDPWGQPFQLVHDGRERFLVISGGPSGRAALTDDEKQSIMGQPSGQVYLLDGRVVLSGRVAQP